MSDIKLLTDSNFDSTVENCSYAVVKFFAEWCSPCKIFAKTFEEFAIIIKKDEVLSKKLTLIEIDIDESPNIASKFEIRSIPATILLKKGIMIDIKIGSLTLKALQEWVENKIKSEEDN